MEYPLMINAITSLVCVFWFLVFDHFSTSFCYFNTAESIFYHVLTALCLDLRMIANPKDFK